MSDTTALSTVLAAGGGDITVTVWLALAASVILVLANGFFVALEFAFIATQKSQLDSKVAEGDRRAIKALDSITNLNAQVAGAQLGITLATIAMGRLAEPSIAALLEKLMPFLGDVARHNVALVISYSIVTIVHLVIGEMVPKNLALADPAGVSMRLAPLHHHFVRILTPFIWFVNVVSNAIVRILGVDPLDERGEARTPAELASLLEESQSGGVLDAFETSLLLGALDLRETQVSSIMVPWAEVDKVSTTASVQEIEQTVISSGHSRFPVVSEESGAIAGLVHAKDLFAVDPQNWDQPYQMDALRKLDRVADTMNLEQVLGRMQRERRHFALVVDAAGATSGIITLEDVLESVVGDINDETDLEVSS